MEKIKKLFLNFWEWFKSLFRTRYDIHVSYNSEWGDSDDQHFPNVRKITKQTEKELRFIDQNKSPVIIRSAAGLNYKIEEE